MVQIILLVVIIGSIIKPELLLRPKEDETQKEYRERYNTLLVITILAFLISILVIMV